MTSITFVDGEDDWCGYYVDGRLYDQNHSLSMRQFVEHLAAIRSQVGSNFMFDSFAVTDEFLEGVGLPENLYDIPQEARTR